MKPYLIVSDIHAHSWSAFSQPTAQGVNSRLAEILAQVVRAATMLRNAGGSHMVVSGDLFHVRGSISPSVLNPVLDCFRAMINGAIEVHIIPGNHDLEGKHSDRVSSAVTALEGIGCKVYHKPATVDLGGQLADLLPWHDKVEELLSTIDIGCQDGHASGEQWGDQDLIIHAPINGTIKGIPDHGLEPEQLHNLGFKRVFAGHYHNHKFFDPSEVYSVGAIGHHTWSDVGSLAGFVLVHPDRVEFIESSMPKFVDVTESTPADDIPKLARGNYVRVKVETTKASDITNMRTFLEKAGALGTVVISVKKPTIERQTGAVINAGATMEASVASFVKGMTVGNLAAVEMGALRVLAQAELQA